MLCAAALFGCGTVSTTTWIWLETWLVADTASESGRVQFDDKVYSKELIYCVLDKDANLGNER